MKAKNTLVILIPGFPANEQDSTCLPMQQAFIKALHEDYPQLNIIILSFEYPYTKNIYTWHGISVIPFRGKSGGLRRIFIRKKINAALKKINATENIIGLLSFWHGECALIGKRFADKTALTHFCWLMGQDARAGNKYVAKLKLQPYELIALSDSLRNEFSKNYSVTPAHVIVPGIEVPLFKKAPIVKDIDILAAGSLITLKQYQLLPGIIAEIKKTIPGVKAMLIGDGPEKEKIKALIQHHHLEQAITIAGTLPYPQTIALMQRARVFIHLSSFEGFSGVCMEALHAGAQVISFCQPMNSAIANWHVVADVAEMNHKLLQLLMLDDRGSQPGVEYNIKDTAKKIMALFLP